jgi:H+/Cl- antiporter ClcA
MQKIRQFFKTNFSLAVAIFCMAVSTGLCTSFFLQSLHIVTTYFQQHNWLLYAMPLAGILIYYVYKVDRNSSAGNNAIIDAANNINTINYLPNMWWQVLISTLLTHVVGGSAGREGTAVQMSGSIGFVLNKWFKISDNMQSIMAYATIAAGFSAVFGTPIAAAVFAIEVVAIGNKKYSYLPLCLGAAFIAHFVCIYTGATHTSYTVSTTLFSALMHWPYLVLIAFFCGVVATFYIWFSQICKAINNILPHFFIGIIIVFVCSWCVQYLLGTNAYFGLGVDDFKMGISIVESFTKPIPIYGFAVKLLLTAIVLNLGFKGGEVTPLFFIGALLGNAFAQQLHLPLDVFVAIGFVTVFAVCTNTPIACIILGAELFGIHIILYLLIAIPIAYFFSGKKSIYNAQLRIDKKFCITKFSKLIYK